MWMSRVEGTYVQDCHSINSPDICKWFLLLAMPAAGRRVAGNFIYMQYVLIGTPSKFWYQCPTYTQTDIQTNGHTTLSQNFDIVPISLSQLKHTACILFISLSFPTKATCLFRPIRRPRWTWANKRWTYGELQQFFCWHSLPHFMPSSMVQTNSLGRRTFISGFQSLGISTSQVKVYKRECIQL